MQRWVTLSRNDTQFQAYLDGTFSKEHRALPVRSLNVNTLKEEVTFEVVPVAEIQRPVWPVVWLRSMRPQSCTLSAGPMLVVLIYAWLGGMPIDWLLAANAFLGVVLFHISMNLRNDYYDHLKGPDRINQRGGSRAIQKGWLAAKHVQSAGFLTMVGAVLFGLPVVLSRFGVLFFVGLLTLVAGVEFSSNRLGLKYRGWGEFVAFLLTGPFLTGGFAWAVTGRLTLSMVFLGCVFGALASLYYHLGNLEHIMTDSQANVRTLAARLGFEKSIRVFWFLVLLPPAWLVVFAVWTQLWTVALTVLVIYVVFVASLANSIRRVRSCLSSELLSVRRMSLVLHAAVVSGWILGLALQSF